MREKPPILDQIRDIIEREYATPPIVSGKYWEARATEGIWQFLEPLIQQAKAEVAREIEQFLEMHLYARPDESITTMKFTDWLKLKKLLSKYIE